MLPFPHPLGNKKTWKHIVKEDFEAKVVERQHVEPLEPYYICVNDGKFISGLEDVMDGQCFFVKESDAAKAWPPTFTALCSWGNRSSNVR